MTVQCVTCSWLSPSRQACKYNNPGKKTCLLLSHYCCNYFFFLAKNFSSFPSFIYPYKNITKPLNGCHTADPTPHTSQTLHTRSKSSALLFPGSKMTTAESLDLGPYSPFSRPTNLGYPRHCPGLKTRPHLEVWGIWKIEKKIMIT